MLMYDEQANIYDLINKGIPYEKEYRLIKYLVDQTSNQSLLDVGCGTGELIKFFPADIYDITGIDYSKDMLSIAKQKQPSFKFFKGDMKDFNFNRKFGVVSCLGSAIQYNLTMDNLEKTIQNFVNHANNYVIFDTRYCIERWIDDYVKNETYEDNNFKIHEYWISNRVDSIFSVWEPKFCVYNKKTGYKNEYKDYHKIRLFSVTEITDILSYHKYQYELIDINCNKIEDVKQNHFYYLIKVK